MLSDPGLLFALVSCGVLVGLVIAEEIKAKRRHRRGR